MVTKDIAVEFKGFTVPQDQDINILLLGKSGVGKSTFINSVANYVHFKHFSQASEGEILMLIPPPVKEEHKTISADKNEYQEVVTKDVKTYVFPIDKGNTRLRLIDSAGLANPGGIDKILEYLSHLKKLHAVCILIKPTTTFITAEYRYSIREFLGKFLSRLEKLASKNIIFIMTNTRGSNYYTSGDTLPRLKVLIDEIYALLRIQNPLKGNIFSFDTEAFKFLVDSKHGINFDESYRKTCTESWDKYSKESWRLISYIAGDTLRALLKSHQVQNTTSINEAKRLIDRLSQPLADISQLIDDNIRILGKHQYDLQMENQSLDALKQKLYIPIIDLQVIQLTQPVTVCTSTKCADVVKVGDKNKWHYKQICHDPCYLTGVAKEHIGDPNLQKCAAMLLGSCMKCTCNFSVHMHVHYLTKTVDGKIVDGVVQNNIQQKEIALLEAQKLIVQIERRKKELEEERETIIRSTAQFARFLQHNANSPFKDYYKAHIEYLINREKSLDPYCDLDAVRNLEALLRQYEEIKEAFDKSLKLNQKYGLDNVIPAVTAQSVIQRIHKLYKLKHNGNKIHEFIKREKISRNSDYGKNCEHVHSSPTGVYTEDKSNKMAIEKKGAKSGNKTDDEKKKNLENQCNGSPQNQYRGPPQGQDQVSSLHDQYQGLPEGHYQQSPNQICYNKVQEVQCGPSYKMSSGGRERSHSPEHNEGQDRKSGKEKNSTSGSKASEFLYLNSIYSIEFLILLEAILCWYLYNDNGYVLFLILLFALIFCWYRFVQ